MAEARTCVSCAEEAMEREQVKVALVSAPPSERDDKVLKVRNFLAPADKDGHKFSGWLLRLLA